jgi:hypothetical protein
MFGVNVDEPAKRCWSRRKALLLGGIVVVCFGGLCIYLAVPWCPRVCDEVCKGLPMPPMPDYCLIPACRCGDDGSPES